MPQAATVQTGTVRVGMAGAGIGGRIRQHAVIIGEVPFPITQYIRMCEIVFPDCQNV
jgi:hypothetical protein